MKKIIIIICGVALGIFILGFLYFSSMTKKAEQDVAAYTQAAIVAWETRPIWKKKIQTNQDLKLGIITDTHVHPTRINRNDRSQDAPRQLKEKDVLPIKNFVAQMEIFQPDAIMHLGDVIEGTGDEDHVGITGIKLVRDEIAKVGVPIHWAIGNHDLRSVTKEQFQETLSLDGVEQVFDIGDYRFIFLDANYDHHDIPRTPTGDRYIRGHITPHSIEWLREQLATDKRVFVFLHHGVFLADTPGDLKEDSQESKMKQSIDNADDIRELLREYRADALFNGHMEARRYEEDGLMHYYSLTGTKKSSLYPQSYYELTITDGQPDLTMYYTDPVTDEHNVIDFEGDQK